MIESKVKIDEYYQALLNRDSQYVGVYYAGVKTTGVFCISTCRARKPKKKNVVFFQDVKEALQHGFRPCKICKPTQNVDESPAEIKELIDLLTKNPTNKIKDTDLKSLGYTPEKIRRWFKTNFGITFQSYQRMVRINSAYENLKKGNSVTASAFDSGYESLSGFGYSFKNMLDISPRKVNSMNLIYLNRFSTPLGPMYACSTSKGICLLEFTDRKMLETEFKELTKLVRAKIIVGKNLYLKEVEKQVLEYFRGERYVFDIPIDAPGTDFQKEVWDKLKDIPFGSTLSYQEMANSLNRPKAVRAVANANGHNRISIIIPCHRIIGSDNSLVGYGGGLPRKKWLLEHERKNINFKNPSS